MRESFSAWLKNNLRMFVHLKSKFSSFFTPSVSKAPCYVWWMMKQSFTKKHFFSDFSILFCLIVYCWIKQHVCDVPAFSAQASDDSNSEDHHTGLPAPWWWDGGGGCTRTQHIHTQNAHRRWRGTHCASTLIELWFILILPVLFQWPIRVINLKAKKRHFLW